MSKFNNNIPMVPITKLLEDIVDNRGKSCPTCEKGFPLIATNCIKHTSIYPTFENIRYVSDEVLHNWFRAELKPNDILFVSVKREFLQIRKELVPFLHWIAP